MPSVDVSVVVKFGVVGVGVVVVVLVVVVLVVVVNGAMSNWQIKEYR